MSGKYLSAYEKDYTSEIIKIARHSVKPIQKDVLSVWQLGHIVHILKYLRVAFKFIMSSYCQWSHGVVSYNLRWAVQHDHRVWYMHALLIILTGVGLISWRRKWGMYGGRKSYMLQCNVPVNHLKINYKIVLKVVTPI